MKQSSNYQNIYWSELIAFDSDAEDCGLQDYLAASGRTPDKLLLLLWNSDFILSFNEPGDCDFIRDDCCSYAGHWHGYAHPRQRWTVGKLKHLLALCRQRNIRVYLSVFDQIMSEEWAACNRLEKLPKQWIDFHPEVRYVGTDGIAQYNICPLKRLADGSFYEDYFASQLIRVLKFYGFDGFHGADGYSHLRWPLNFADFSRDMVEQFCDFLGSCRQNASGNMNKVEIPEREAGKYIWSHLRQEWVTFYCHRTERFWHRIDDALSEGGFTLLFNSIWARDPVEAAYRYGFDYRTLTRLKSLEGVVAEAVSTVIELEGQNSGDIDTLFKSTVAVMRAKALLPEVPFFLMNSVNDTEEQYSSLRHAPMRVQAEVLWNAGARLLTASREQSLFDGFVCCLACGLAPEEWSFMFKNWDSAAASKGAGKTCGVTVLWSSTAWWKETMAYCRSRFVLSNRLHSMLMACGAPVSSIADIRDLQRLSGPVLALNPAFLSEEEKTMLEEYTGGVVFRFGAGGEQSSGIEETCSDEDPLTWLVELPAPAMPPDWIGQQAKRLIEAAGGTECSVPPNWLKLRNVDLYDYRTDFCKMELASDERTLLLRNNCQHYLNITFPVPEDREVSAILPNTIVLLDKQTRMARIKLPPYGCGCIKITRDRTVSDAEPDMKEK